MPLSSGRCPEVERDVDDHGVRPEEEAQLQPKCRLVVERVLPEVARHELGQHDGDRAVGIRSVDGVESARALTPEIWMAWTEPGRAFGAPPIPIHGQHGSPRCRTQLAIVSGGDHRVGPVARSIEHHQPSVLDWAPMIAELVQLGAART